MKFYKDINKPFFSRNFFLTNWRVINIQQKYIWSIEIYFSGFFQTENNNGESNPENFENENLIAYGR